MWCAKPTLASRLPGKHHTHLIIDQRDGPSHIPHSTIERTPFVRLGLLFLWLFDIEISTKLLRPRRDIALELLYLCRFSLRWKGESAQNCRFGFGGTSQPRVSCDAHAFRHLPIRLHVETSINHFHFLAVVISISRSNFFCCASVGATHDWPRWSHHSGA